MLKTIFFLIGPYPTQFREFTANGSGLVWTVCRYRTRLMHFRFAELHATVHRHTCKASEIHCKIVRELTRKCTGRFSIVLSSFFPSAVGVGSRNFPVAFSQKWLRRTRRTRKTITRKHFVLLTYATSPRRFFTSKNDHFEKSTRG